MKSPAFPIISAVLLALMSAPLATPAGAQGDTAPVASPLAGASRASHIVPEPPAIASPGDIRRREWSECKPDGGSCFRHYSVSRYQREDTPGADVDPTLGEGAFGWKVVAWGAKYCENLVACVMVEWDTQP